MIKIAFSEVYCYTLYHCLGLFISLPRYSSLLFHYLPSSVSFLGWVYFFHNNYKKWSPLVFIACLDLFIFLPRSISLLFHCLPGSISFLAQLYFLTISVPAQVYFFPCKKMKNSRENQKKKWGWYIYCMYCEVLLSGSMSGSSAYTPKSKEKQDKDDYTCQGPSHRLL